MRVSKSALVSDYEPIEINIIYGDAVIFGLLFLCEDLTFDYA